MESNNDIYVRVESRIGRITLTRPQALNAVNQTIVDAMTEALLGWETDEDVSLVLVDAEGEKAFSAGGDLAFVYRCGRAGDIDAEACTRRRRFGVQQESKGRSGNRCDRQADDMLHD